MFELLSDVQSVPVDQESLFMIQRGMNKVRVSVGDHISEPSEVYIITGLSNGNLESYIIFYMLEPRIHVVYGCDQNPYASEMQESVIEEAITFVEEMGSILEEVPWETMTPDQKSAWIEKEILYSAPEMEELEEVDEIEEVEEIEAAELIPVEEGGEGETELEYDPAFNGSEDVVEVSEAEMEQALSESDSDESLTILEETGDEQSDQVFEAENIDEPDEIDEDEEVSVDSAGPDDVVVAEGDFDELLKQAFLKPDVHEKTRIKKGKGRDVKVEIEEDPNPDLPEGEETEWAVREQAAFSEADESAELEEKSEAQGGVAEVAALENDQYPEEEVSIPVDTPAPMDGIFSPEPETRLLVLRFLSRF